jgi:poly(hydroxyalkanoate) granule-associated protein
MAKQLKTRRPAAAAARLEARDLWLAGLGAVSLTRKNGIKFYGTLLEEGKQFQGRFEQSIAQFQGQARQGYANVRNRVEAAVSPIRERAEATYGTVKAELETRLAPVLDKLGMKPAAKARARKTAKRVVKTRATAKRATRKAKAA